MNHKQTTLRHHYPQTSHIKSAIYNPTSTPLTRIPLLIINLTILHVDIVTRECRGTTVPRKETYLGTPARGHEAEYKYRPGGECKCESVVALGKNIP